MKLLQKIRKICTRGHVFYKSSDCPVCPECWSGYYKKKSQSDFPDALSAPALRALHGAHMTNLKVLTKYTEAEVLALHGMGPTGIIKLRAALKTKRLSFKKT